MQLRAISITLFLALTVSLSVTAAGPVVPKAVQRAVTAIFGSQKPAIEHESEGGTDKYEVGAPTRLEVVLDAQGSVEEIEVKIPVGLVPPAVLNAAKNAMPMGTRVEGAELLVRGKQLLYEIEGRSQASEVEVVVDPGGSIVGQHVETEADDEADDD